MAQTALILIDIQNDYFPGGKMELAGSPQAARKARMVLDAFREKNLPRFHIQHFSIRPGASFLLPDTPGSEIHQDVAPLAQEPVIPKIFPNSFRETSLQAALQEQHVEQLVICGMMTHMCVDATTRAAFDLGFACTVVQDACATRDMKFRDQVVPAAHVHSAFLGAFAAVYAKVVDADELIAGL